MTEINRLYMKRLGELGVAKSEHTICLREALAGAIPNLMAVRNKFGKWSLGFDESNFEAMKKNETALEIPSSKSHKTEQCWGKEASLGTQMSLKCCYLSSWMVSRLDRRIRG